MAQSLSETEISQLHQQQQQIDNNNYLNEDINNDDNVDELQTETVDEILAHDAQDLGNWEDIVAAEELPNLENGTDEEQPPDISVEEQPPQSQQNQPPLPIVPEVYPHKLAIVRGCDLAVCQVPDKPPFNLLVFELPDTVTEEELYMLFGGKRAIESHMYRRDLREIIFNFKKKGHLVEALLKENMTFKEKQLRLAVILFAYQIDDFHFHNQNHKGFDVTMIPFNGAYDKCHERLEDGSLSELFDEDNSSEAESIIPNLNTQISKKFMSNDVRINQQPPPYCHQNSIPSNRQRKESTNSITSVKSVSIQGESQSISRQSSNQPSDKPCQPPPPPATSTIQEHNYQSQQSIERQQPPSSPAPSTASQKRVIPRNPVALRNPFGEAKPVNTDKKVLTIQEKLMTQKSVEQPKNISPPSVQQPPQLPQMAQPHPQPPMTHHPQAPRFEMGTIRIQKRPEGMPIPAQVNGPMQFINSMYAQPPPQFRHHGPPPQPHHHQQQQQHHHYQHLSHPHHPQMQQHSHPPPPPPPPPMYYSNNVNVGDEIIDVSKPPPFLHKREGRRLRYYNNKKDKANYQNIPNGFNSNNMHHQNTHSSSHQSLPPGPPIRRKSSTDQRAVSETIQTEKSQSAPVSHETVAMSQNSPRSSPSCNSLKRPNSANSSMSFVTAHSGSEMSSAMSTDLPCILDSQDSITERLSDITDEHRRHSWEGRDSPARKKEGAKKKNSWGSRREKKSGGNREHNKKSSGEGISRQSSASTPQYQSASNVFLDVNDGLENTVNTSKSEILPEPIQKALTKAKNIPEKRAPSLPLSRPHTSSNEKAATQPKLDESNKPDSMSAPPTPSGSSKKKSESRKKDNKRKNAPMLQNNKFSALMNAPI